MIVAVPVGLIALTMYQEGALQTTKDSVKILTAGINHFRRLKPEDMDEVRQMQGERPEAERGTGQTGSRGRGSKKKPKRSSKRSSKEASAKNRKKRNHEKYQTTTAI